MTVSEMIKVLNQFPNFLYVFYSGSEWHQVILGGYPCPIEDNLANLKTAEYYFDAMKKLYEKGNLTDEEKRTIGNKMKRIRDKCNCRMSILYSLEQQEEYLNKLDPEALEEISGEIQMYQQALEYYRDYAYNI